MSKTLEWVRFYGDIVDTRHVLPVGQVVLRARDAGMPMIALWKDNVTVDEQGRVFVRIGSKVTHLGTEEV